MVQCGMRLPSHRLSDCQSRIRRFVMLWCCPGQMFCESFVFSLPNLWIVCLHTPGAWARCSLPDSQDRILQILQCQSQSCVLCFWFAINSWWLMGWHENRKTKPSYSCDTSQTSHVLSHAYLFLIPQPAAKFDLSLTSWLLTLDSVQSRQWLMSLLTQKLFLIALQRGQIHAVSRPLLRYVMSLFASSNAYE